MAKGAPKYDAVVFNKVALICMGTMAAASVIHMLQPLWTGHVRARRAWKAKDERER